MLDNGAYSFWRERLDPRRRPSPKALAAAVGDWDGYYNWVERWGHYRTTWAVIPDVIDGTPEANEALIAQWPHGTKGAPVWHMHEPISRLLSLCWGWPRVCIGSSGEYSTVGDAKWHRRMEAAMNSVCGNGPVPVWLHMLRGMSLAGSEYPFTSVDSTDIARNHAGTQTRPRKDAKAMAERWDAKQCGPRWSVREQLSLVP